MLTACQAANVPGGTGALAFVDYWQATAELLPFQATIREAASDGAHLSSQGRFSESIHNWPLATLFTG